MRRHWAKRVLFFIVIALAASAVFGFVVMRLWNWLALAVFGWHLITFWQAVGILFLARILVGRLPGRPGMRWRGKMMEHWMERWEQMTPEEREKFRAGMRGCCGPMQPPAPEQKA